MSPRRQGRPTDCTPEVTERVCRELRGGLSISSACAGARISKASYCDWRVRGESGEQPFADFLDQTTQAIADGSRALELTVRKAATTDWRAAMRILESRMPDEWSRRTELTGKSGGPVEVREVKVVLTSEAEAAIFDDETGS